MDSQKRIITIDSLVPDEPVIVKLKTDTGAWIGDAFFEKGIVTKLEIRKNVLRSGLANIFVIPYMKNKRLCMFVFNSDIVFEEDGSFYGYRVRERRNNEADEKELIECPKSII